MTTAVRGRSLSSFSWDRLTPFILIAPSIVLIAVFVYLFIGYTAFVSTTQWYGIVPDYTSAGLTQYADLFGLPRFQADINNTIEFTILFLFGCILLGFGAAVLNVRPPTAGSRRGKGRSTARP